MTLKLFVTLEDTKKTKDIKNTISFSLFFSRATSLNILDLREAYRESSYSKMTERRQGPTPEGAGVLPHNWLLRMCRWMGLHFYDWTDYKGVAFSGIFNRVNRMGSHFFATFPKVTKMGSINGHKIDQK